MDKTALLKEAEAVFAQIKEHCSSDAKPQDLRRIRSQMRSLNLALYEPEEAIFFESHWPICASAVRTLMKLGVVDQLVEARVATAVELAERAKYPNSALIERLLRVLVAAEVVSTPDGVTFHSTPRLDAYQTAAGSKFAARYNEWIPAITEYPKYVLGHDPAEVNDPKHNAVSWCNGQEGKGFFEILKQDPERLRTFNRAMEAREANLQPVVGLFPFETLRNGPQSEAPLLVDVGGGNGNILRTILDTSPQLAGRVVLQDLPQVLEAVPPEKLNDIKPMEYNFHDPQPVHGARAYHLRRVLHDHGDEICQSILHNTVRAMTSDSILLIAEFVMPAAPSPSDLESIILLDFIMMLMGGKERTIKEFQVLLEGAGLELVKVWGDEMQETRHRILEARLKA